MNKSGTIRPWTLRGTMLKWLGLASGMVAISLSATGIWYVDSAADRQIEALLIEELDEVRALFSSKAVTPVAFNAVAVELAASHPENHFAWRLWKPGADELIGEFGEHSTFSVGAPDGKLLDQTVEAAPGYRWRAAELNSGEVVGLMMDIAPHRNFVNQYVRMTVFVVVIGLICILLVGHVFSSKVSRMLSGIAARIRQAQSSGGSPDLTVEGLPLEISEVAKELETMLKDIREETKTSRVLIAGMAHELRAPIQNLIGETEVTLLSDRSETRYKEVLVSHLEEMRYLGDAVNNLVSLCSAKRAAEAKECESFNLYDEVRYRLEREVRRAQRMQVELNFSRAGDLSIYADREALLTALRNLASNALDWVPADGRVEVEFRGTEDEIRVTVEDNGPGIPTELRAQVFEAFFSGPSAEGKRSGYGLGLALARSAVLAQGGSIEVEQSELGGARFVLCLPRERPEA